MNVENRIMPFPLQFTSQCESCVLKSKSILPRGHFDAKVRPLRPKVECTNLIFGALSNVFLTSNHGKDGGFGDDNDDMYDDKDDNNNNDNDYDDYDDDDKTCKND